MKKSTLTIFIFLIGFQLYAQNYNLLVGTFTNTGKSEGIYVYDYNTLNAETKLKSVAKNISNPNYLAISEDKKTVYSVNRESKNNDISAFKFNSATGELNFINKADAKGADPCFVTVDKKNAFLANYGGGSITVYALNSDGSIGKLKQVIQHTGKSIDPRQASAHVHQIQFTPDKKYLVANDLGEDKVYIYKYNPNSTDQPLLENKVISANKGGGPRHLVFSLNGKFAYLVHEFTGMITIFSYAKGDLNKIDDVSTTASDFKGKIDGADIHVSADGKFLYETNRGDANSISAFSISPDGKLNPVETVSTLGKGPRNFTIDPTGKFLLVGHQYTNEIVIFNRDTATGKLTDSGKRINVGSPVCLIFSK